MNEREFIEPTKARLAQCLKIPKKIIGTYDGMPVVFWAVGEIGLAIVDVNESGDIIKAWHCELEQKETPIKDGHLITLHPVKLEEINLD